MIDKDKIALIREKKRVASLENETADLWYDTMLKDARISEHDNEIASIWYEFMLGGA